MLIYEKLVNGVRHLFGNYSGNVPTEDDVQLTYKDADGTVISDLTFNESFTTSAKEGIQYITRVADGKQVNVFIGEHCVIGEDNAPLAAVNKAVEETEEEVADTETE